MYVWNNCAFNDDAAVESTTIAMMRTRTERRLFDFRVANPIDIPRYFPQVSRALPARPHPSFSLIGIEQTANSRPSFPSDSNSRLMRIPLAKHCEKVSRFDGGGSSVAKHGVDRPSDGLLMVVLFDHRQTERCHPRDSRPTLAIPVVRHLSSSIQLLQQHFHRLFDLRILAAGHRGRIVDHQDIGFQLLVLQVTSVQGHHAHLGDSEDQ